MITPKRLLLLGSMDEFVQLVTRAKERGYYVIVADGYEHGPARACADESYVIPVTNIDALATLCIDKRVDALVTSYSDVLFEAGCRIAHAANLPAPCSLDSLEYLRNKELMKSMFDQLDIAHPQSCVTPVDYVESLCGSLTYPCVMKPVDGYGSYGIHVVRNVAEAQDIAALVAKQSTRAPKVILEEYDDGREFNMMTWVVDGEVSVVSIADREKTARGAHEIPHVSRIVYPSRYTNCVLEQAQDFAQRVASFTGITHGPLCMQFFWSPNSGIRVCEVTGRVFGYEHELLTYASHLSVEDLLLDTAFDHDALAERLSKHQANQMPYRSCGLYFHAIDGTISDLSRAKAALDDPLIQEHIFYYEEGDTIHNARGGQPYAARAFLKAQTYELLDKSSAQIFSEFSIVSVDGKELAIPNSIPSDATVSL